MTLNSDNPSFFLLTAKMISLLNYRILGFVIATFSKTYLYITNNVLFHEVVVRNDNLFILLSFISIFS